MSRENVQLVRRMAEAFNTGAVGAVRGYFHPEIEWHEDPAFPESGIGKIVRVVWFATREEALEAVGLSE